MKTRQFNQTLLTLLAVLGFGFQVRAGQMTQAEMNLLDFQAHCNTSYCDAGYVQIPIFNIKNPEVIGLDSETKEAIEVKIYEQAQIWGDTILEGDYVADGKTRIAQVEALLKETQVMGYRVVYFEKAWWVGECDFTGKNPETLNKCLAGHIEEAAFVTQDLNTIHTDEAQTAIFKENILD